MNIKKIVRKVLVSVLVLFSLYGTYNLYKMTTAKDVYNTLYVSGIITDKFESAYSCGKRSVCYARYLKVGSATESVTLDTYVKAREGGNISLVIKEVQPPKETTFEVISAFAGLCFIFIILGFLVINFAVWITED